MTAETLIQEFEELAPAEKAKFFAHLKQKMAGGLASSGEVRYATAAEFDAAAAWVLREHDELLRKLAQ
jgi:hypothetical protein